MNMMTTLHTRQDNKAFRDATHRLYCMPVMDENEVIMKMTSLFDEHI